MHACTWKTNKKCKRDACTSTRFIAAGDTHSTRSETFFERPQTEQTHEWKKMPQWSQTSDAPIGCVHKPSKDNKHGSLSMHTFGVQAGKQHLLLTCPLEKGEIQ